MADDLRAYARAAAVRHGAHPDLFIKQIQQESGFNPDAFNAGSGATGIAQIIPRWHPGVDASDPYASLDYAAKWMSDLHRIYGTWARALAAYNWGPANVAKWDGKRGSLPAETRHYLDVTLGEGWPEPATDPVPPATSPVTSGQTVSRTLRVTEDGVRLRAKPGTDSAILATLVSGTEAVPLTDHAWRQVKIGGLAGWIASDYLTMQSESIETQSGPNRFQFDPNTPDEKQRQPWTCAIRSTMWLLKSIGIDVTPDEAQDAMSPRYVNSDVGLLDASGAGIVAVLRDRWGVKATAYPSLTFDQALEMAGRQPLAIGGRNWGGPGMGHWSAVRGRYQDSLVLANPAGTGARFGQASLTRQDWARMGPFSGVAVDLEG